MNNSATLPAAVDGTRAGQSITVHFSAERDDHIWVVELRPATDARGHLPGVEPGERIGLPGGAALVVTASYPEPAVADSRLWTCRLAIEGSVTAYLGGTGGPSAISYVPRQWPLSQLPDGFRPTTRQRRDGQCSKAIQHRAGDVAGLFWSRDRTDHPARRRVLRGARRAAGGRAVRCAIGHRTTGQPDTRRPAGG